MIEVIQEKSIVAAEKKEQAVSQQKQLEIDSEQIKINTKIAEEVKYSKLYW